MPATPVANSRPSADAHERVGISRLLVCWQHPETRGYHAVGLLTADADGYEFVYLQRAHRVVGFRPFLGFSALNRRYRSRHLFPLFAERILDPSRPDRPGWLHALDLGEEATPMEILARSGGHRLNDTIELTPIPSVADDGTTTSTFLVHGVRYQGKAASDLISQLSDGEELALVDEPSNPVNPSAIIVAHPEGQSLGYVPNPLVDYVHAVRGHSEPTVRVVRANDPDVGPHLRLLVRVDGTAPPGFRPFTGPGWEPAA